MKRSLRLGFSIAAIGAALIVAAVLLATTPWSDEKAVEEAATPAEYGLCNVSVRNIPEDIDIGGVSWPKMMQSMVPHTTPGPSGDLITLMLSMPMPEGQSHTAYDPETGGWQDIRSRVVIDAQTGELLFEHYRTADEESKFAGVLATLRVGPWQPIGAAWPRTDTRPSTDIVELVRPVEEPPGFTKERLKYRLPEDGAGIIIGRSTLSPEILGPLVLRAYTCESIAEVRAATGEVLTYEVVAEEEAMFQRFLSEVVAASGDPVEKKPS